MSVDAGGLEGVVGAGVTVDIRVLGPVEVAVGAEVVRLSPALRRIVGGLALNHPEAVGVGALTEVAHGRDDQALRRAVRTAVWRLRALLPDGALITEGDAYRLDPTMVAIDLRQFETLVTGVHRAARSGSDGEVRSLAATAVGLWRGTLLGDDGAEVAPELAERVRELRDRTVEEWASAAVRQGVPGETLRLLEDLVGSDPLREGAWARLITSLSALGQRADLVNAVDRATDALAEVGLDPGGTLADAMARARSEISRSTRPEGRNRRGGANLRWLERAADGPLLGRHHELDAVAEAIEAAERGAACLVAVTGEPGVGKTRLVAEAVRRAEKSGIPVWGGRFDPYHLQPFGALLAALADVARGVDPVEVGRMMLGPLGALFGPSDRASLPSDSGLTAPPGPWAAGSEQFDLFEAAATLFEAAIGDQVGLLVVDDVHWAPRGALLLLRHLIVAHPDLRLCVVVTARPVEAAQGPTAGILADLMAGPGRVIVPLSGLRTADIAGHPVLSGDSVAGVQPAAGSGTGWSPDDAERLRRLSGGNPLLLGELLRQGPAATVEGVLSPGVRGAIELRLSALAPEVRRVLVAAAVIGVDIDVELLRTVLASEVDTGTVHAGLAAAEQAELLRHDPGRGTYSFRHEVIQAALLDGLSGIERAELHLAVADRLEEVVAGREDSPLLYPLAFHLHGALATGGAPRALRWGQLAADRAAGQLDFGTAAQLFEQAAVAAGLASGRGEAELLVRAGLAWRFAGDVEAARVDLERAVVIARDGSDGPGLVLAARVLASLGLQVHGRVDEATRALLRSADTAVAGQDVGLGLELRLLRGISDHAGGALADYLATSEVEDPRALFNVVTVAYWGAPTGEHAGLADLAVRLAARLDTPRDRALAGLIAWLCRLESGGSAIDHPVAAGIDADVAAGDDPEVAWMWATWGAVRHLATGRFAQAETAIEVAHRMGRRIPASVARVAQAVAVHHGQMSTLRVLSTPSGRFDEEVVGIDRLWTLNPNQWDATVALARARTGRTEEARELFERATATLLDPSVANASPLAQLSTLTQAAELLRDREAMGRLLVMAERWDGYRCLLNYAQYLGPVATSIGTLRYRLGDLDGAVEALETARAGEEEAGAHAMRIAAEYRLVQVLRRRDRPADRVRREGIGRTALAEARRLGMPRVVAGLERLA